MPKLETTQIGQFDLEIDIAAPTARVWRALTEDVDRWWLADFRAIGEGSTVHLEARAGGALIETHPDGAELVWYQVQMVRPGSTLYLVGHTAPDWGGPSLSMLKLSLEGTPGGCRFAVSDSILGRLQPKHLDNVRSGWQTLFGSGLRDYVEGTTGAR